MSSSWSGEKVGKTSQIQGPAHGEAPGKESIGRDRQLQEGPAVVAGGVRSWTELELEGGRQRLCEGLGQREGF